MYLLKLVFLKCLILKASCISCNHIYIFIVVSIRKTFNHSIYSFIFRVILPRNLFRFWCYNDNRNFRLAFKFTSRNITCSLFLCLLLNLIWNHLKYLVKCFIFLYVFRGSEKCLPFLIFLIEFYDFFQE